MGQFCRLSVLSHWHGLHAAQLNCAPGRATSYHELLAVVDASDCSSRGKSDAELYPWVLKEARKANHFTLLKAKVR